MDEARTPASRGPHQVREDVLRALADGAVVMIADLKDPQQHIRFGGSVGEGKTSPDTSSIWHIAAPGRVVSWRTTDWTAFGDEAVSNMLEAVQTLIDAREEAAPTTHFAQLVLMVDDAWVTLHKSTDLGATYRQIRDHLSQRGRFVGIHCGVIGDE